MLLQISTICALTLALLSTNAFASEDKFPTREQEDERFSVQLGYFNQSDGDDNLGGNPHIDEEETVFEALIILDKKLSETDIVRYQFLGDLVTSASVERENNEQFQILQSHPSGNKRGELSANWSRVNPNYTFGFNSSFSAEYSSFFSIGLGANISRPIANDNARIRFAYQGYFDTFEHKQFNGVDGDYVDRFTHTYDVGITQTLTPKSLIDLSLNYTHQTGVLGTTWYSVFVNGQEQSEQLPSSRNRSAYTLRYKYALSPLSAIELDYRAYDDSWGLDSNTWEVQYQHYLRNKTVLLTPRVRYYDQNPARYFATDFNSTRPFMSSDPDLGDFTGRSYGIKGSFFDLYWPKDRKAEFSVSFDQYKRSDGIDLYWTTFGYTTRF